LDPKTEFVEASFSWSPLIVLLFDIEAQSDFAEATQLMKGVACHSSKKYELFYQLIQQSVKWQ
jgi:hypothetical protein